MEQFILTSDIEETIAQLGENVSKFEGKTVLLSGGCGFLGKYFTEVFRHMNEKVLSQRCRLIVIDNFITADQGCALGENSETFQFIEHDITKPIEIDGQVDFVIHAAGIASPHYYRAHPLETLDVGITGTRNMLEIAKEHHARFLFFSSSEIYGDPDPTLVPTSEAYRGNVSCQGPRACYDESKRVGETLCYIYHELFGVSTNIVRPFNVYGPGMKENDFRVLSNFGHRIKAQKPLKIYGTGGQTRTFCYVTDALNGFLRTLLLGIPGETYNIGNPEPEISMLDLAEATQKVVKEKVEYKVIGYPDDYPGDEPKRRCPDIRKARVHLAYDPSVALSDGLKRFYDWALKTYTGKL